MTQSRQNLIILLVSYIDKETVGEELGSSQDPRQITRMSEDGIKCSKGLDVL